MLVYGNWEGERNLHNALQEMMIVIRMGIQDNVTNVKGVGMVDPRALILCPHDCYRGRVTCKAYDDVVYRLQPW